MDSKNKFMLDFASAPSVAAMFHKYRIGETCEITMQVQINQIDNQSVCGTILKIAEAEDGEKIFDDEPDADDYGPEGLPKEDTSADAPIMAVMSLGQVPTEGMPLP